VEVARRQAGQTARQRRRSSGGRRTRISQTTTSSGIPLWRGAGTGPATSAMVTGCELILALPIRQKSKRSGVDCEQEE
jgi:hypothetical protein